MDKDRFERPRPRQPLGWRFHFANRPHHAYMLTTGMTGAIRECMSTNGCDMNDAMLRADCARCAGLCCVAHAFDHSEEFAFDKPCDEACHHLTSTFRCAIHAERPLRGFAGCERYECFGAGQKISDIYEGRTWRDSPAEAQVMFENFRKLRKMHELLVLLRAAGKLPLPQTAAQRRQTFEDLLAPASGWTSAALRDFRIDAVKRDVSAFLVSLKDHIAR